MIIRQELLLTVEAVAADPAAPGRYLSPEERRRAQSYVFERDRLLSAAAHGLKRRVLGELLGIPVPCLRFDRDAFGRPFLSCPEAALDFNLSHSGARVALAVGDGCRVGVDIEAPSDGHGHLLSVIRDDSERDLFPRASDFAKLWTLKEALSKAIGVGLRRDFRELVLRRSDRRAWPYRHGDWFCRYRRLDDGYHLAIACERPLRLRLLGSTRGRGTSPRRTLRAADYLPTRDPRYSRQAT